MKKTFLCFSLSFALLASALNPLFSADVFAKAKLAKTKITLTVGQKKKITIKGKKKKAKYTFKASNKKVSVNKKGVVTAKKAGKTKITVKEKLKKKTKKILSEEFVIFFSETLANLVKNVIIVYKVLNF